eukprot:TRINITY_DN767_c0_g1_i1.p1 TRINITY_DN767_c0_g1~~TRINITY_DN767_c0_g1_i1.p1  ORF type:complete len:474 (+),score=107.03 TRINITY_DN767_c0_g1_i1:227-1648(+)
MVDFFNNGMHALKLAVQYDEMGSYDSALKHYIKSADFFVTGLKYSKNQKTNELVRKKVEEVFSRSEILKKSLSEKKKVAAKENPQQSSKTTSSSSTASHLSHLILSKEDNSVQWDDVAGLGVAKRALTEAVLMPTQFPQLFKGKRTPWKGILLYGPPGTGKTFVAKGIASISSSTFISVSASDLLSKYVGESEKILRDIFNLAHEKAPAIIFIDEIDALLGTRTDDESETSRRFKTEFLVQMNKVADAQGVLVLGATNRPFDLDPAVRRRFEKRIYIPLPDKEGRLKMITSGLGEDAQKLPPSVPEQLACVTEGYSGADLSQLTRESLMFPLRDSVKATHWKKVNVNGKEMYTPCGRFEWGSVETSMMSLPPEQVALPPLRVDHVEKALETIKPSVSQKDLQVYEEFTQMYGEHGTVALEDEPMRDEVTVERVEESKERSESNASSSSEYSYNTSAAPKKSRTKRMLAAIFGM